jgi:microcystin-dependent protein
MPWTAGVFNRANGDTGWQDDAAALIPIAANRHDDQDNDFKNGINNCLVKDGSNTPTANLNLGGFRITNAAAAVNPTDYARYDQVTGVTPVGVLLAYSGGTAPSGWLICDGSAVSRTSYGALNALYNGLSYPYGSGDGSTTFNLPDLRRRYIAGKGASDTLGFTEGGNITGTAYASRSMSHTHAVPGHYHSTTGAGSSLTAAGQTLGTTSKTITGTVGGSDGTHDHDLRQEAGGGGTAAGSAANIISLIGSTVTAYRNSANHYTGGGHGHGHSLAANISHTHAASAVSGTLGLVTGGANGDGSFNAGSTATGSYLFLNYIVKT